MIYKTLLNSPSSLNITIKNTGKSTLNASAMNVFINGTLYNYGLISAGNVLAPKNSTIITINGSASAGNRIKIVTENGISDYALVP